VPQSKFSFLYLLHGPTSFDITFIFSREHVDDSFAMSKNRHHTHFRTEGNLKRPICISHHNGSVLEGAPCLTFHPRLDFVFGGHVPLVLDPQTQHQAFQFFPFKQTCTGHVVAAGHFRSCRWNQLPGTCGSRSLQPSVIEHFQLMLDSLSISSHPPQNRVLLPDLLLEASDRV
jgi:hypothetical protein